MINPLLLVSQFCCMTLLKNITRSTCRAGGRFAVPMETRAPCLTRETFPTLFNIDRSLRRSMRKLQRFGSTPAKLNKAEQCFNNARIECVKQINLNLNYQCKSQPNNYCLQTKFYKDQILVIVTLHAFKEVCNTQIVLLQTETHCGKHL